MKPLLGDNPAVSRDAIIAQLAKILASTVFQGAERSTRLLRYLVEHTANGHTNGLKEYTLGADVLGKGSSFDPRTDTIVRAEASRLRNRLERYYAAEGQGDPLVITLLKGSYIPQFQTRTAVPKSAAGVQGGSPSRSKSLTWFAVGLGVAACLFVFVVWSLWRVPPPDNAVSIAVLPFVNVSADPNQEFFSDGMTDEISGALAKIPDLRVVGRSSAFQFKGESKDLRTIGQGLGATHLIEGSVRQVGNRVRIAAQLIEAKNGLQLWSESYDRELTDVFAIQADIATAIASALRMPLGFQQGEHLVSSRIADADSYRQYLQAKALVRVRGLKPLTDATALLEQVVARDPDFAPAWALLSLSNTMTPLFHPAMYSGDIDGLRRIVDASLPRAEAAAERAIQLEADLADGYSSLGFAQHVRGKFLLAEDLYMKALALDPNNSEALFYYSELLSSVGRLKESLRMKQQLQALEPFVPIFNTTMAIILWVNGQNDAAIAMLKSVPADVFPAGALALIYASMGLYGEAADSLLQMRSVALPLPGTADQIAEAARLLRSAPAAAVPQTIPDASLLNFVFVYVGDPNRALGPSEFTVQAGYASPGGAPYLWQSSYSSLRKTERFKAYLREAGRVDYWRARGWPDHCRPLGPDDFTCD